MTRMLPPLDMHAHIDTSVGTRQLEQLGAVVFAATRSVDEFERTLGRHDLVTIWGVGCHPGLASAQSAFDADRFAAGMARTPFISEIGLDSRSKVQMSHQTEVFQSILGLAHSQPRILSIHSRGATSRVLDIVEESKVHGVVLHWWLGSQAETRRAVDLGCYFSINMNMDLASPAMMDIPLERLLTETDHPSGNRGVTGPRQPGWTLDVEEAIARLHEMDQPRVRDRLWSNLAELMAVAQVRQMVPDPISKMLATAERSLD